MPNTADIVTEQVSKSMFHSKEESTLAKLLFDLDLTVQAVQEEPKCADYLRDLNAFAYSFAYNMHGNHFCRLATSNEDEKLATITSKDVERLILTNGRGVIFQKVTIQLK